MNRLFATCSVCALIGLAAPAHASVIINLAGAPTADSGGFDYTYGVTLSQDEQLNTSVQPVFFTIYDFGSASLIGTTGAMSTDWTFALNADQPTAAEGTIPNNDPGIFDVRASYTGPVILPTDVGSSVDNLGTFTLFTSNTGPYAIFPNDQDAQLAKYAPGTATNDTPTSNLAAVAVPTMGRAVPEPTSIAVIGMGLLGLGAARRRRNRGS